MRKTTLPATIPSILLVRFAVAFSPIVVKAVPPRM